MNKEELVCGSIALFLLGPTAMILFGVHFYKYYQDMYTKQRACLSHRRRPAKITKIYANMNKLTLVAVGCYSLLLVLSMIGSNFVICGIGSVMTSIITTLLWYCSKIFLNLTYIYRLHQCYGQSAFSYRTKSLIIISILIILFLSVLGIGASVGIAVGDEYQFTDNDGVWPHNCNHLVDADYQIPFGTATMLIDLILMIASIIAFILPINKCIKLLKLIQAVDTEDAEQNRKKFEKMLYAGFKCKVCVICASVTSLIWVISLLFGVFSVSCITTGIDFIINMICLMLMTPYYDDNIWYKRLCCLCIVCCDKQRKSCDEGEGKEKDLEIDSTVMASCDDTQTQTDAKSNKVSVVTDTKSIDTMDIIPAVAKKHGAVSTQN